MYNRIFNGFQFQFKTTTKPFIMFFCYLDGEIQIYRHGQILMEAFDRNPIHVHYFRFGTYHPKRIDFHNCLNKNAEIINRSTIEICYSQIEPNDNAEIMSSANKLRTLSPTMALFVALFIWFFFNFF